VPELPDITVYCEALQERLAGATLTNLKIQSPNFLRTATPPIMEFCGAKVSNIKRIGKQIVIEFADDRAWVLHLMIAGRLKWQARTPKLKPLGTGGKIQIAGFEFTTGILQMTEAGTHKRASLHAVASTAELAEFNRGGLEIMAMSQAEFAARLKSERHTLKRSLTDPTLFSGIGNAYSDEILHAAQLSPMQQSTNLSDAEIARLHSAIQSVLQLWIERLRAEAKDSFPANVTAFRQEMAAHGKYLKPCPVCQTPIQRIRYATNECNYCPTCQTDGKLLADRALSRLLKDDWPKSLADLEQRKQRLRE
jgi:formamidopyrimidine-DNA glycosylase